MTEVQVTSKDVDNLVRQIKTHADAKALRRELSRGLNSATKYARGQMVEVIPSALPKRGGLADLMRTKVSSSTSAKSGKWAGVSIRFQGKGGYDIRTVTGGRVRHPVFGHNVWVDQTEGVKPAVFFAEFDKQKPSIQRAIVAVLDDIARKVTNI